MTEITDTVERGEAIIRDENGREVKRVPVTSLATSGRIWSHTGEDAILRDGWSIEYPRVILWYD